MSTDRKFLSFEDFNLKVLKKIDVHAESYSDFLDKLKNIEVNFVYHLNYFKQVPKTNFESIYFWILLAINQLGVIYFIINHILKHEDYYILITIIPIFLVNLITKIKWQYASLMSIISLILIALLFHYVLDLHKDYIIVLICGIGPIILMRLSYNYFMFRFYFYNEERFMNGINEHFISGLYNKQNRKTAKGPFFNYTNIFK